MPLRLTNFPGEDFHASWSPDGKFLMFISGQDDESEIYILDIQTKNLRRITNNKFLDVNPAWSPEGSAITFASMRDGNFEIYLLKLK